MASREVPEAAAQRDGRKRANWVPIPESWKFIQEHDVFSWQSRDSMEFSLKKSRENSKT
jgi:hypothetical protein